MSARTTADNMIEEAREHVGRAIEALQVPVIDQCWGWDQFNDEYQQKIQQALNALLKVRRDLK
jgi:GTPase